MSRTAAARSSRAPSWSIVRRPAPSGRADRRAASTSSNPGVGPVAARGERDAALRGHRLEGGQRRLLVSERIRAAVREVVAADPAAGVEDEVVELPPAQRRGLLGGDHPVRVRDPGDAGGDQQAQHGRRLVRRRRRQVGDADRLGQGGEEGAATLAVEVHADRRERCLDDEGAVALAAPGEGEAREADPRLGAERHGCRHRTHPSSGAPSPRGGRRAPP